MRPTASGSGGIAAAGVLLLLAWFFGSEALAVPGLAACLALCSGVAAVAWNRGTPMEVLVRDRLIERGEGVLVQFAASRPAWRPIDTQFRVVVRRPDGVVEEHIVAPTRRPDRPRQLRVVCSHHGWHQVGPLRMRRRDLLGLFQRETVIGEPTPVLVRPVLRPVRHWPPRLPEPEFGAGRRSTLVGGGDFDSLRAYAPGDDARRIHWPATARTGEPWVRQETSPGRSALSLLLDVDIHSYGREEDFEQGVDAAASLLDSAIARGALAILALAGDTLVTGPMVSRSRHQLEAAVSRVLPRTGAGTFETRRRAPLRTPTLVLTGTRRRDATGWAGPLIGSLPYVIFALGPGTQAEHVLRDWAGQWQRTVTLPWTARS